MRWSGGSRLVLEPRAVEPDRHAERLAENVPERQFDAADRRHADDAHAPEAVPVHDLQAVLDIARDLTVDAIIRSRLERSTQEADKDLPAVYGVEFIEEDEERRLLLCAYVFSRIANGH